MTLVLSLNAGSSTLKFRVFRFAGENEEELSSGSLRTEQPRKLLTHVLERVRSSAGEPDLVGHRMVHGGSELTAPVLVDEALLERLERISELAPLHLPPALTLLREALSLLPRARHVCCFDTAFHHDLPELARRLPLPDKLYREGIRRYGFHGLSYEHVLSSLPEPAPERLIVAHLGSGASMAAVLGGRCIDTTMGFTPSGGIPMGSRTGDLDPGVLFHLARERGYSLDQLEQLVNHESGLKGIAGSADVEELTARAAAGDGAARLALAHFAYAVKKQLGAYVAALGGVDCVVFTGGIGEHAPLVRELALSGLSALGIELDAARNDRSEPVISSARSHVTVRIVPANEDLVIARAALALGR